MKIDEKVYDKEWFHQKYIIEKSSVTEIADEIGVSRQAVTKKLQKYGLKSYADDDNAEPATEKVTPEVTPEPEKVTSETQQKPNLYRFGAKTHYRDLNDPSRPKKSTEFSFTVLADNVVDALRRAEIEIKKQSNDLEFSIMVLYGSAVTVYPPRKKE